MVRIGLDNAPLKQIHDPSHPLAGPGGSYLGSNVNLLVEVGMPALNWSDVMFRKRRTENGEQTAQARGDSSEVTAG